VSEPDSAALVAKGPSAVVRFPGVAEFGFTAAVNHAAVMFDGANAVAYCDKVEKFKVFPDVPHMRQWDWEFLRPWMRGAEFGAFRTSPRTAPVAALALLRGAGGKFERVHVFGVDFAGVAPADPHGKQYSYGHWDRERSLWATLRKEFGERLVWESPGLL
jgi:hypothetical protein